MTGNYTSWPLAAAAALPVGGLALFCAVQLRWAWRTARQHRVEAATLRHALKEATTDSILPGLGGVLGISVMAGYLGTPLAWLRFALAGGLPYEMAAATLAAGRQLANLTPQGYGTIAVVAALGTLSGPVLCLTILPALAASRRNPGSLPNRRNGFAWMWLAGLTLLSMAAPIAMSRLVGGPMPPYARQAAGKAFLGLAFLYWPGALVEFLASAPLLGTQAAGLSFLAGNVANVRLACAVEAQTLAHTRPGTPAGEAVATLAAAASTLTTVMVATVGAAALAPFAGNIGEILRPFTGLVQVAVFALYALPAVKCVWDFIRRWQEKRRAGRQSR